MPSLWSHGRPSDSRGCAWDGPQALQRRPGRPSNLPARVVLWLTTVMLLCTGAVGGQPRQTREADACSRSCNVRARIVFQRGCIHSAARLTRVPLIHTANCDPHVYVLLLFLSWFFVCCLSLSPRIDSHVQATFTSNSFFFWYYVSLYGRSLLDDAVRDERMKTFQPRSASGTPVGEKKREKRGRAEREKKPGT